jgi:hypothetical protein
MSLYHVVGSKLVPPEQAREIAGGESRTGLESAVIAVPGTEPIGAGRPLSIIVRHLYTGRYPKPSAFGGSRRDMLLTSAVRDVFTTFNAAPRAINFLRRRVPANSSVSGVDANESGTPLVFYSPAVTMVSTTVTIEMAFDDFPDELVSRIGGAIASAGGIPLFGPYGPVMIGVGMAVKLLSNVVNSLTDARPEFSVSERLEFELPDGAEISAGYRVLCESTFDPTPYTFALGTGLVDRDGRPYRGPEPYVVLLLDGARRDTFKSFQATAATAVLLERFLQQKDGSDVIISSIVDAVKVSSDLRYRREADSLITELAALPPSSPEYKAGRKRLDALIANIDESRLRPKIEPA